MAAVNFAQNRKQAEEAGMLGGGDIYKIKEGDNRFRLMSNCLAHRDEFKGQPNFKWLCYVLDRKDGGIKAYFMPHKVYKAIEALQVNPDYQFTEVPMPYDLTVSAKKAGTKEVEYTLIPARREVPLTPDEQAAFDELKPIEDVKKALDDKKAKESKGGGDDGGSQVHGSYEEGAEPPPLTDSDIPFAWLLPLVLPALGSLSYLVS